MITKELVNFITKHSQDGVSREIISRQLIDNGWLPEDVEEGFKATKNKKTNGTFGVVVTAIFLPILISSIFYLYNTSQKSTTTVNNDQLKAEVGEVNNNIDIIEKENNLITTDPNPLENNSETSNTTVAKNADDVLYDGKIYHIFFHSLIVYPELAFDNDGNSSGYKDWMITRDEFQKILPSLYEKNFILIDITSLYDTDKNGNIIKKDLFLPKGKKPLIISLDDLSYYPSLVGNGFARKLVLDSNDKVATEVVGTDGKIMITREGDVVPILDDFVNSHPDFSKNGAKGVIALTGYQGILGYRTDNTNSPNYTEDIASVKNIVSKLKDNGWLFASHSYSHNIGYSTGKVSLEKVKKDAELWDKEVRPLVGDTDIFIGPYGQVFKQNDPRRLSLVSNGFKMFCGVGMDLYLNYSLKSITMNRADIDGYRMINTPNLLKEYFDVKSVTDTSKSF